MVQALVITPVKDSLQNTLETIEAISKSNVEIEHIVYNDFSNRETRDSLQKNTRKLHYKLINLEDITNTPSPNYKLVLQLAQRLALEKNIPLIVVESDVTIKPNTFTQMLQFSNEDKNTGLVGAITVDSSGKVNFPYLKFKNNTDVIIETKRSLSFCCTLLSVKFLKSFNFENLNQTKDWYDTIISKKAVELNFKNYVLTQVSVIHKPHSSRPWKQLKYKNPIKYYLLKLINRRDKI
jgi:hypothetical protein